MNDSSNNDSSSSSDNYSNIGKPTRVNNYSYAYNIPHVNKYMVLSVVIGIFCLFVIGFVAVVTTEVQNNKPYMKQYYKQNGLSYMS
jgi:hypothetical protein